jgi:hypothetical protein
MTTTTASANIEVNFTLAKFFDKNVSCVNTQNELNVALVKSVYSMIPVVAIVQFLYRMLPVKIVGGHVRWREKERKRRWEKSVRDSLLPERFDLLLLNLTMGQIPSSSMMDNLPETNCTNKMTIMIRQEC